MGTNNNPVNVLGMITRKRNWEPPGIDLEQIAASVCEKFRISGVREFLYIFQTEPYIDSVYIILDFLRTPRMIKRFVFREGYAWKFYDEEFFHIHCIKSRKNSSQSDILDQIYTRYSSEHPEWHLRRYYAPSYRLLDHIYHCMRRNSVKELLYKAGLDELAADIDDLDEIDLLSATPSEIYGGLPIKVLRSLNCREGAKLICTAQKRKFIRELNLAFPDTFCEELSNAQCCYLLMLMEGRLSVGEAGRLFRAGKKRYHWIWSRDIWSLLIDGESRQLKDRQWLNEMMQKLGCTDPIYGNHLNCLKNSPEQLKACIKQLVHFLTDRREEFDRAIRRSNRKRCSEWQERSSDYIVRYPQTINDFCREAIYMDNCLMAYIDSVINNETTILFMRKSDHVNDPFITIDVQHETLMQAYHRFNRDCTPEEADWITDYCRRHRIDTGRFRFNRELDRLY